MSKSMLLLGGTGPAGIETIKRALPEFGSITIYARTPSKLPTELSSNPKVHVIQGTLQDTAALRTVVAQKPDVIVSLLGPADFMHWANPFSGDMLFVDTYRVLIDAMREHGVDRILLMGTLSIYDPKDKTPFIRAFLVWAIWACCHGAWKNIVEYGKLFDAAPPEIKWTIFRLGIVQDGPCRDNIVEGYVGDENLTYSIRRSEIAEWLVTQALKDEPEWVHQKPAISGPRM